MPRTRLTLFLLATVIMVVLLQTPAEAFWGFGSGQDGGASGLDLIQGYDRNTVATYTGRVAASPSMTADPVTVDLVVGNEKFVVIIGPRWYLQDDNLDLKPGDIVTTRGSRAQGKDGRIYLLSQWVRGASSEPLVLRNESGRPGWSGGFRGGQPTGGAGHQQRGGAGARKGR